MNNTDSLIPASSFKNCATCGKRMNKINRSEENPELCKKCLEKAGIENAHQDGYHNDEADPNCADCNVEIQAEKVKEEKVLKQPHFSHKNCDHPRTPKDRAICRKEGAAKEFHAKPEVKKVSDDDGIETLLSL